MPETTLVFEQDNHSEDNFQLIDQLKRKFVGSVKWDQHRDLAEAPHDDPRFDPCTAPALEGTKAFRVQRKVAGKDRVLVITWNQNLSDVQCKTVQNDLAVLPLVWNVRLRSEPRSREAWVSREMGHA